MADRNKKDRDLMPPPPSPPRFSVQASLRESERSSSSTSSRASKRGSHSRETTDRFPVGEARTDISNTFTDGVKIEVVRLAGEKCWACLNTDLQFAHVVAQKDGQVSIRPLSTFISNRLTWHQAQFWIKANLFPFSLKMPANCIPLCSACHGAFDRPSDPCWVFLPTDLDFFIQFEITDQHRRANDPASPRRVPTIEQYRDHQVSENMIPPGSSAGFYRSIWLKDFLHDGHTPLEFLKFLSPAKKWHGHPLAAIRRGISVLGSARCYSLDATTLEQLTILRQLYFDDKNLIDQKLVQLNQIPVRHRKRNRSHDSDDESPPTNKKRPSAKPHDPAASQNVQITDMNKDTHYKSSDAPPDPINDWVFGPAATGNDIIARFAPVMKSTDVIKLLG